MQSASLFIPIAVLIRQLQEEMTRYELGLSPPPRQRVDNDEQLQATIGKRESLQRLETERRKEPDSPARKLSLLSLCRTIKQLQEEIAWYQAHHVQRAQSSLTETR